LQELKGRKPTSSIQFGDASNEAAGSPANIIKTPYFLALFLLTLILGSVALYKPLSASTVYETIPAPETRPQTIVSGKTALGRTWVYLVPFEVKNREIIEKLIGCESQGVNVSRPDSNGVISWGILQYNGTSTWGEFSRMSGILGTPVNPPDAIRLTDWAIDHGFLSRWSCARILKLLK